MLNLNKSVNTKPDSARRQVWRLAWPTILEQCLNLTVGLNEVFLIGHLSKGAASRLGYDSALALAGTSLGQYFNWIMLAAFNGVGIAATALVARSIGAKEKALAVNYGRQSLVIAFGIGLVLGLTLYLSAPFLLYLLGAEGQLQTVGLSFVHITAFGMPLYAVLVAGNACLRGSGDTRTPLVIMLIVNATNIAVAWLFINGEFGLPTLGVQGAALGATLSWSFGAILVLSRLWFGLPLSLSPRTFRLPINFRLERQTLSAIWSQALPTIGEQWIFQLGIFFFARMLVSQGTLVYAAHNTVITIDSISFLPGIGLGIANTVLVGQNLGAGKPEQAQLFAFTAYKMGLLFMTIMGGVFFFFPEILLGLLINDPQVVAIATPGLRVAGLFDPLVGTSFIMTGALRGAGDTKFPLYARFLSSVIVRVSLGFLFLVVLNLGLVGGRLAMGCDTALLAALVTWRFKSGKWKTIWQERTIHRAGIAQNNSIAPASKPISGVALEASVSSPSPE